MKDNISLVAAAAGGFMLSVALSGILRGTPVVSWQGSHCFASSEAKVQFRAGKASAIFDDKKIIS